MGNHINEIYVKQTASKKRQNLSSTLCLKIMKKSSTISIKQLEKNNKVDDNEEYETRTKIEKEVIVTSSTSSTLSHENARSCVKRCSFTQNLAKTFVEWGHKIKFPEFNINRKTIFFVKN